MATAKNNAYIVKAKKDSRPIPIMSKKQFAKRIAAAEKYPFKK